MLDGTLKGLPKYREFKVDEAVSRDLKEIFLKVPAASKGKVIRLAKAMSVAGFDKHVGEIAANSDENAGRREAERCRADRRRPATA